MSWSKGKVLLTFLFVVTLAAYLILFPPHGTDVRTSCTVEWIGDFPGGDYPKDPDTGIAPELYSEAADVSEDGTKVVGHGTVNLFPPGVDEYRIAAAWTSPTGSIGFWNPTDPPGLIDLGYGSSTGTTFSSYAGAISDDGKVVAGNQVVEGFERPTRWIANVADKLTTPGQFPAGDATDVSADGRAIVGYMCVGPFLPKLSSGERIPVWWGSSGGDYSPKILPTNAPGVSADAGRANAVSGSGEHVVGNVYDTAQGTTWPAFWRPVTPTLPLVPPWPDFVVHVLRDENGAIQPGDVVAISEDGKIAVGAIGTYPNMKACYWSLQLPIIPPIKATLIPTFSEDCNTTATAVTNWKGLRIYGARMWRKDSKCEYKGDNVGSFVWDQNKGVADLQAELQNNGGPATGWRIEQVQAISKDGNTLVGTGYHDRDYIGWVCRCQTTLTTWGQVSEYVRKPFQPWFVKKPPPRE